MLFTAKMIFFKSLLTGAVVITNQAVAVDNHAAYHTVQRSVWKAGHLLEL